MSQKIPCSFCGDTKEKQIQGEPIKYRVAAVCYKCVTRLSDLKTKPPKVMTE